MRKSRRAGRAGPARFRRLRKLIRNPKIRSRLNRFQARRFARKAAKRTVVRYTSKAPRYPGAIWLGQTVNTSGPFSPGQPKFIVQHYTAGNSGLGSAKYLFGPHSPASSAHYVVDRDGQVWQICGNDLKAWHAGKSQWKGLDGLNSYSIGIEYANLGWSHPEKGQRITAKHKNEKTPRSWEVYPDAQIEAGLKLTQWLKDTIPTIKETMGHDDISPGRKSDPGPAFPMSKFQDLFKPKTPAPAPTEPAPAETAVAVLGFAGLNQSCVSDERETMTNAHDQEDLSEGEAAIQYKTAAPDLDDDGDEPINPPLFNQEQGMSLFRTILQLFGAVLVTKGVMTPTDVVSMIEPIMVLVGAALTVVVTWWGIRSRSSKNLVRSARRIQRERTHDAKPQL